MLRISANLSMLILGLSLIPAGLTTPMPDSSTAHATKATCVKCPASIPTVGGRLTSFIDRGSILQCYYATATGIQRCVYDEPSGQLAQGTFNDCPKAAITDAC
ncbi:hypothetical protein CPC08DRAFT_822838 [Agrocybe pediades]|nr:hypothetical protein CPC08DRAFT_822838 [Agrocybe pediades]